METGLGVKSGKAPGPDGVARFLIRYTMKCLAPTWARCFTGCLRGGHFPRGWRRARLVLVKKPGKPDFSPSSYRPICLLSEAGKLFERVIVQRLHAFLNSLCVGGYRGWPVWLPPTSLHDRCDMETERAR